MKLLHRLFGIILLAILSSCQSSDPTPAAPPATNQTFTLTVNNGDGSGTFTTGDTAYIFSNPTTSTQVFDKWTGDVTALTNPNEWRTTLTMPSTNINVTATYKTISPINFTNVVINGSQVYYYVPATYRGIIIPFHGAGGNATGWVGPLDRKSTV